MSKSFLVLMTNLQSTFLNMQQFKLTIYNADALVDTGRTNITVNVSLCCKNVSFRSSVKPKIFVCFVVSTV